MGLALPVLWTAMQRRGIALERIGEWMGRAPAKLAGLTGRKGAIGVGADADLVVFDPDAVWKVNKEELHFKNKISPYVGAELRGRVKETWLRGERIYEDGGCVAVARGRELVKR